METILLYIEFQVNIKGRQKIIEVDVRKGDPVIAVYNTWV